MRLNDWILTLHVLSASAMVSAMVLFWMLGVAMRNMDTVDVTIAFGRVAKVGNSVIAFGVVGTIVFGIWLAISLDDYDVWEGWIVTAIVLLTFVPRRDPGHGRQAELERSTSLACGPGADKQVRFHSKVRQRFRVENDHGLLTWEPAIGRQI